MSLLQYAIPRATDQNDRPISGAFLYVFAAGTTRPVKTFSDRYMTSPNTHPVVADASGVFGEVHMPTGSYKLRMATPEGVIFYEADNVGVVDPFEYPPGYQEQAYAALTEYASLFHRSLIVPIEYDDTTLTVAVGTLALVSETTSPYDAITIEVL